MKRICLAFILVISSVFLNAQEVPGDFPVITTNTYGETAPGKIFLTVSRDIEGVGFYMMILNNDASPYYYKKLRYYSYDFKRQSNGYYSYMEYVYPPIPYKAVAKLLDPQFTFVDSFLMTKGNLSDAHDFQILPNGHYLLFTHEPYPMDLTEYGGYPNAEPIGTLIQEFDSEKNLVWQWRYYDHFSIEDSPHKRIGNVSPDLIHTNSLEIDTDGNLMVSSINAEFAFKINRQTGDVMWVLGGDKNMFSFSGVDSATAVGWFDGHDLRRLSNGDILYFDNKDKGAAESSAHICEWKLDEENLIATLVWQYIPDPPVNSITRGNAQRLPDGNTFIGWGAGSENGGPVCTEVTSEGDVVFDLHWNQDLSSYRAFRMEVGNDPQSEMTAFEVRQDDIIDFIQGDTLPTGVNIRINSLTGEDYNELDIKRYPFAPYKPVFPKPDPRAYQQRIVLSANYITTLSGEISFGVDDFEIADPQLVTIYKRANEGQGLFLPLPTVYNAAKDVITATFSGTGEFIFTYPDAVHIPMKPNPYMPTENEKVNSDMPVILKWAPEGFLTGFDLQISYTSDFTDPLINESNIGIPYFEFTGSEVGRTYYWRVRTENENGFSDWSVVSVFMGSDAFVELLSPVGQEKWIRGLDYFISWEDNIDENVILTLYKGGLKIMTIDTVESNGAYLWTVPVDAEIGSDYKIEIRSLTDNNLLAQSEGDFSLADDYTQIQRYDGPLSGMTVYPNPSTGHFYIEYSVTESSDVKIQLFNTRGRLEEQVFEGNIKPGTYRLYISGDGLAPGIYLVRIKADGMVLNKKISISH